MASRRTPASVSNHHVAPPFPQGARRCSASAPLGVGSRRAAAIPGGECTHPQFVHGRGHAPAFGRFAHVSPSPLVARQSEFCGSRPSLSLGRCAMCGSVRASSCAVLGSIGVYMLFMPPAYVCSYLPALSLPKRAVLALRQRHDDPGRRSARSSSAAHAPTAAQRWPSSHGSRLS